MAKKTCPESDPKKPTEDVSSRASSSERSPTGEATHSEDGPPKRSKKRQGIAARLDGGVQPTEDQRAEVIRLLRASTRPSLTAIANLTGLKRHHVRAIQLQLEGERDDLALIRTQALRRQFAKRLPVRVRGELYAALASGKADAKVARVQLDALTRIERLEGIVTAAEAKEIEGNRAQVQALFVLDAGARPSVRPLTSTAPQLDEGGSVVDSTVINVVTSDVDSVS